MSQELPCLAPSSRGLGCQLFALFMKKPLVFHELCWVFPPSCSFSRALCFNGLRFLAHTDLGKLEEVYCSSKKVFKCIPHALKVLAMSCPVSVQDTKLKGSSHTWSLELLDLAGFLALSRTAVLDGPSGNSHQPRSEDI